MKLDIQKHLPKQRPSRGEVKMVQCRLPEELHAKMTALFEEAREEGLEATWQTFIEAACLAYIEERS